VPYLAPSRPHESEKYHGMLSSGGFSNDTQEEKLSQRSLACATVMPVFDAISLRTLHFKLWYRT